MNKSKVIDLLNETMEVYLVREARSQLAVIGEWFKRIHTAFSLPYTFAVFEKSEVSSNFRIVHETVLFILVFYALSSLEERIDIFNVFWDPIATFVW